MTQLGHWRPPRPGLRWSTELGVEPVAPPSRISQHPHCGGRGVRHRASHSADAHAPNLGGASVGVDGDENHSKWAIPPGGHGATLRARASLAKARDLARSVHDTTRGGDEMRDIASILAVAIVALGTGFGAGALVAT